MFDVSADVDDDDDDGGGGVGVAEVAAVAAFDSSADAIRISFSFSSPLSISNLVAIFKIRMVCWYNFLASSLSCPSGEETAISQSL